jgi:hypothetical protein
MSKSYESLALLAWTLPMWCCHNAKKGGEYMKIATSFLAALLFTGTLGAFNNATAEDGVLVDQDFTDGSYCHLKFPAISEETLGDDNPVLTQNDVIDFYGSCSEDPRGEDQIQAQKLEDQHRWETEYEG